MPKLYPASISFETQSSPLVKAYSEHELVMALKERSHSAYTYLYTNYSTALYGIIQRLVKDEDAAADILQEVFIKIWNKVDGYDETRGSLFTWLLTVARNTALDTFRSKAYSVNCLTAVLGAYKENVEENPYRRSSFFDIRKMVSRLQPRYKVLIELCYFYGYTQKEVSEMMNMPLGTVKTHIRKGLQELKTHLAPTHNSN